MPRNLPQAVAFLLGFWIALLLSPFTGRAADADEAPYATLESELHRAVNAERASRHLIALERRGELDRVARAHSADMASRAYLSHVTPEGVNPVGRLEQGGVDGFSLAAENAGQTSKADPGNEIFAGWLASPVHRENLHAPPFNATGVGVARSADGTWYFTQLYLTYPR
jgi:uncharacterized protein YkwD